MNVACLLSRSSGLSFTLPSTMTDGVPSGPKDSLSSSMKHDYRGTSATWNLEDPCFLDRESVCWASVFSARVVT